MITRADITLPSVTRVRDLDRWFDEIASEARTVLGANPAVTCGVPPLNAWMTDEAVFVEAELPGFSLDKVELTVTGRDLTIRGERDETNGAGDTTKVLRRERPMGAFVRTIRLPVEIENEGMQATLKDGVLRITVPRTQAERPRRIEVRPE
jgi:HSP20 family protein